MTEPAGIRSSLLKGKFFFHLADDALCRNKTGKEIVLRSDL